MKLLRKVKTNEKTTLMSAILDEKWNSVVQRIYSDPTEVKLWAKIDLPKCLNVPLVNPRANIHPAAGTEERTQVESEASRDSSNAESMGLDDGSYSNIEETVTQKWKVLPIHVALMSKAPLHVIKALITAYPLSVQKRDGNYNRYPLHFACLHNPRVETVDYIIRQYKLAITHRDSLGRVPLHYAAFGRASVGVIDRLLLADSKGVEAADKFQWLPLHVAVRNDCQFAILRRLVEAYPSSIESRTRRGSNVLNLATNFFGPGSVMEQQVMALQAAVSAIYDLNLGRLSLESISDAFSPSQTFQDSESETLNHSYIPQVDEEQQISYQEEVPQELRRHKPDSLESQCSINSQNEGHPQSQCPKSENKDLADYNACVVCLETERTHAFVPCGHLCVCQGCSLLAHRQSGGMNCPLCRKKSFMVMKVFV